MNSIESVKGWHTTDMQETILFMFCALHGRLTIGRKTFNDIVAIAVIKQSTKPEIS